MHINCILHTNCCRCLTGITTEITINDSKTTDAEWKVTFTNLISLRYQYLSCSYAVACALLNNASTLKIYENLKQTCICSGSYALIKKTHHKILLQLKIELQYVLTLADNQHRIHDKNADTFHTGTH